MFPFMGIGDTRCDTLRGRTDAIVTFSKCCDPFRVGTRYCSRPWKGRSI